MSFKLTHTHGGHFQVDDLIVQTSQGAFRPSYIHVAQLLICPKANICLLVFQIVYIEYHNKFEMLQICLLIDNKIMKFK